ncbi:MAG: hypothetical protein ABUL44_02065 [Flavobacterium sp.]
MRRAFELFTEIVGWLQIVAGPLFAGIIIGALVYNSNRNITGLIIGISIALLGLVLGIIWATKIWRKKGTVRFLSRIMATPELDKEEKEIKEIIETKETKET